MKKLIFTALMALSLFMARPVQKDAPVPTCDPCPWVR